MRSASGWAGLVVAVSLVCAAQAQTSPGSDTLSIGTGPVSGVYLPVGNAICAMVNRSRRASGVHCMVLPTEGSAANLEALAKHEIEFAIAQSEIVADADNGRDRFAAQGPVEDLRAVFALHPETLSIVVQDGSGIRSFDDLKGKRVAIGAPGSGARVLVDLVLAARGWTLQDFAAVSEIPATAEADALCDGRVDAAFYLAGNPTGLLQDATTRCDTDIVPVPEDLVADVISADPALGPAVVPGGLYRNTPEDVPTIGTSALLVTTASEPADRVYQLVRAVFENLPGIGALHPALFDLKPKQMVQQPFPVPVHDGALRYYRERGWR